jgi:hypothetical protein
VVVVVVVLFFPERGMISIGPGQISFSIVTRKRKQQQNSPIPFSLGTVFSSSWSLWNVSYNNEQRRDRRAQAKQINREVVG